MTTDHIRIENVNMGQVIGLCLSLPKLTMPCGIEYDLQAEAKKGVDIRCGCGDKTHWVVRWA